jgi:hypothetical protein
LFGTLGGDTFEFEVVGDPGRLSHAPPAPEPNALRRGVLEGLSMGTMKFLSAVCACVAGVGETSGAEPEANVETSPPPTPTPWTPFIFALSLSFKDPADPADLKDRRLFPVPKDRTPPDERFELVLRPVGMDGIDAGPGSCPNPSRAPS